MLEALSVITPRFILLIVVGSIAGLFVGSLPGLSVAMATAILVSVTYTWQVNDALALVMGVYVVGVFSGAVSAILIRVPGAPSSVATTLDGFPLSQRGEAYKALWTATWCSFIGSVVGLLALWFTAKPVSYLALQFSPMDFFLLALFGLTTIGSLASKSMVKGLISGLLGVLLGLVGGDPLLGIGRFTYGSMYLYSGINVVPAIIGLYGFAEVIKQIFERNFEPISSQMKRTKIPFSILKKNLKIITRSSIIGVLIGALPGTGGPLAALLAYNDAKNQVKNPEVPFGEGAVEGIVASETSNNATIGGALIPLLTLAVPGDGVTAILISVFYVHGLRPGPLFLSQNPTSFYTIVFGGLLACIPLLLLGLFASPLLAKVITVPKSRLMPIVAVLCIIGAYAVQGRTFDIFVMIAFGILALILEKNDFSVAPIILGLVLGSTMDANLRRAISQAASADNMILAMFGRPITIVLTIMIVLTLVGSLPQVKQLIAKLRYKMTGGRDA